MDDKKTQSEKNVSSSDLLKRLKVNIAENPVVDGEAATADEAREIEEVREEEESRESAGQTKTEASAPSPVKRRVSGAADLMLSDLGGEGSGEFGRVAGRAAEEPVKSKKAKPASPENDKNAPDATSYKAEPKPTVFRFKTMTRAEYNRQKALKSAGLAGNPKASADNGASKKNGSKDAAHSKNSSALLDRYKSDPEVQSAVKNSKNRGKVDLDARIKDAEEYAKKLSSTKPQTKTDPAGTAQKTAADDDSKNGGLTREEIESVIGSKPGGDFDETDMNLMIAFGMDDELKKKVGEDKAKQIEEDADKKAQTIETSIAADQMNEKNHDHFEFVAPSQAKSVFKYYKACYQGLLWRLVSCAILLLITFFYENIGLFGLSLPAPVSATVFPVVHILIGMQFTVLAAALIYKPIYKGMLALFSFKPIPESGSFVMLAFTMIYEISLCFLPFSGNSEIRTYNFPMVICVFLTILYEFLNLRREIFSFNVAASKKPKSVVAKVPKDESETENELFYKLMPDDPQFMTVKKTQFVDNFYKRVNAYPKYRGIIGVIIPVSVALALGFFAAGWYVTGSVTDGVMTGYTTLMMTMPVMTLLTYSYPFYKASKESYAGGSAIISKASLEEYESGEAITFDDREVFPSFSVKVKTVQVVGSNAIDEVMYNAACVFAKIGGPLADVLDIATLDMKKTSSVEILEIADDGIEAVVDKTHILLGKADYMTRYNVVPINPGDEKIEGCARST